jgi:hypothetical protein
MKTYKKWKLVEDGGAEYPGGWSGGGWFFKLFKSQDPYELSSDGVPCGASTLQKANCDKNINAAYNVKDFTKQLFL